MYRLILVPLDGSLFAEHALPLALSLSRRTHAHVHLLTVQESLPTASPEGWEEASRKWHQEYLDEVAGRIRSLTGGGEVTTRVRVGHVVEGLQAEAEARGADLVVMATHGRGAFSRAWMGAIADSFIRHTDRPVILARPKDGVSTAIDMDQTISRVLLPLDGTAVSEQIIDHAAELGGLFGAAFHLVRVLPFPKGFKSSYPPHMIEMNRKSLAEARDEAEGYLQAQAGRLTSKGLAVDTAVVEVGQAGHGILTEAEEAGCDFIAMATHGRGTIARTLLGHTADKVLRGAQVPVLLYRPRD